MQRKTEYNQAQKFSTLLLNWNRKKNTREMPWKGEKDPYKIWLSEIILQQTRVEQGLNYYQNFISTFPDVHKLAAAPDNQVFKLWEGLGYYTRCKNLLATARFISNERKGVFPNTYEEINQLKGIGPYTAAAISSFAFNLPHAVVDGNVFRVIARIFGIDKATDTTEGKKFFTNFANELLDKKQPGIYNQAIMDFGAVVCKPMAPLCTDCVFNKTCFAFQNNRVNELPVKKKKISVRKRWFNYLVLEYKNEILLRERESKDIWQHLFEFNLIETMNPEKPEKIITYALKNKILKSDNYKIITTSPVFKQLLSHQVIIGQFIHIQLLRKPKIAGNEIWVSKENFKNYPFPKLITQYLNGYL